MSTHLASEIAGLLSVPRSMNVRRKEPENCTLETPACLTKSLRICAVSVPSAAVPVGGICNSVKSARCPSPTNSTGLTRKLRPKRSGASMPCARGWLVRSAARDGGGPAEGACGIHADVSCKENFAAFVKKIMPRFWDLPIAIAVFIPMFTFVWSMQSGERHRFGLTVKSMWIIIIFTYSSSYAQETAARPQDPGPSATGLLESSSRTGHRRTVPDQRIFQSSRPNPHFSQRSRLRRRAVRGWGDGERMAENRCTPLQRV